MPVVRCLTDRCFSPVVSAKTLLLGTLLPLAVLGCDSRRPTPQPVARSAAADSPSELDLRNADLTAERLAAIAATASLKRLRLSGSNIDDAGLAHLAGLPELELLDLVDCPNLTATGLAAIGRITTLRNLRLSGPAVTPTAIRSWRGLNELAAVLLRETALDDDAMSNLAGHKKLKEVNLFGTPITDAAIEPLATLPQLEKLTLRGTAIRGQNVSAFVAMRAVSELDLSETDFANPGLESVARMPALRKLNLWLTPIDDSGLQHLLAAPALTSLNLDNVSGITDASLEVITTLPALTFLHLGGTSIQPAALSRLSVLRQLDTLIVTRLGVDAPQADSLRQSIPSLQRLDW